ncbi:excinuclease ABC subunit A [Clostridium tetani]|uniref:excinuclease ABC subunit UvrA n=1 Tax=Clostridium tetani TaxID=1513 RepID=UPI00100A69DD|nr:excinuclease ABC subunit UvrA [Clostridium tetani]RXI40152.1 excinuclease ABC subunit A [Clostridium tetani]
MNEYIIVNGAKGNNLKNISLKIPKNKLVAITGLSGSGKSTLAFETLQRECQRLYMESLGIAVDLIPRAKVDKIEGLSPSISVEQHHGNMNPRSTVGTLTDVIPFFRILFSKIGEYPCPNCGEIISQIKINSGEINKVHYCTSCKKVVTVMTKRDFSFNTPEGACPVCKGLGVTNEANLNMLIDYDKSIRDGAIYGWDEVYINRYGNSMINAGKHYGFEFSMDLPIRDYNNIQMVLLLYGVESNQFKKIYPTIKSPKTVLDGKFEGVVTNLMRRYSEKKSGMEKLEKYFVSTTCPSCKGAKLKEESRNVRIDGKNIIEINKMEIEDCYKWMNDILEILSDRVKEMVSPIIVVILEKLSKLVEIGVSYLSLDRVASTLSAGELQRIRLATLLGTGLTGVLYVLDEPTTGLHAADNKKLIGMLKSLRDMGNTVLVVAHDIDFIEACDYVIDMGPGAGKYGGTVVAVGTPREVANDNKSVTGKYINNKTSIISHKNNPGSGKSIQIKGARVNNLKNVDVEIPLGKLVTISGVSGAGKSSLLFDVLYQHIQDKKLSSKECQGIYGLGNIKEVLMIDQMPIGRSSRSNAATYTDIFTLIRGLFANLPPAKKKGLKAKDFSFNTRGGRCEQCEGSGVMKVSMHFMPDIEVSCHECLGKRYKNKILEIKYNSQNISDILMMSIDEAYIVFENEKQIAEKLEILKEVGLGYLSLGQSSSTLSGGEAQRIKLGKELANPSTGDSLYLLDEPTTGLHPQNVELLINMLKRMIEQGNSVVVIEHNVDFIRSSDWVIDMGPGGGMNGGEIIAEGPPETIKNSIDSVTGKYL